MKVETFKAPSSKFWGIQVDGLVNTDVSFASTEDELIENARKHGYKVIIDSSMAAHYSHSTKDLPVLELSPHERSVLVDIRHKKRNIDHVHAELLEKLYEHYLPCMGYAIARRGDPYKFIEDKIRLGEF